MQRLHAYLVIGGDDTKTYLFMKGFRILLFLMLFGGGPLAAESLYTLDSCRHMALANNKQLQISEQRIQAAGYEKRAAFGNYLPKIDATGAYLFNEKKISLLGENKYLPVGTLGANGYTFPTTTLPNGQVLPNQVAVIPKEAMEFDVRNTFVGVVSITQPIYLGGKIRAYNQITRYAEKLARSQHATAVTDLIFQTDELYWQVVSLGYKRSLAESYVTLLERLEANVEAMIQEGVATRSDGLTVAVKLNEAQITLTKVEDGLALSKMALALVCGLPVDASYGLADQAVVTDPRWSFPQIDMEQVYGRRSEIESLTLATQIYKHKARLSLSALLPQLAVTGNYLVSNPNVFNGFRKEFDGMFNVGVMLKIPIFNWGADFYKVKAARVETRIARLELEDAKEQITLQVNQAAFRMKEALKKLQMTDKNMLKAEENLRNAQIGFGEGVLTTDNVLEAQTAWLQAQSERIDAQIDVRLCDVYLSKALGVMPVERP